MQSRRARLAKSLLQSQTPEEVDDSPLVLLETLGNASKRGLIDDDLLWTTFSFDIEGYWLASRAYVHRVRQKEHCDCLFTELEALYERVVQKDHERGESNGIPPDDKDAIERFLKWERKRKIES